VAQATFRAMEAEAACSLQDRYLVTQGIEKVVVYQETGQITTTP